MSIAATKVGFPRVLRVQHVRARRDLRDMGFLYTSIVASVIIVAVVCVYLGSRLTFVHTGYEISEINRTRSALVEKNKRLRVEFERLKSPERIERIATKELGLSYPTTSHIVRIR
jgi:cell division protein FtsL